MSGRTSTYSTHHQSTKQVISWFTGVCQWPDLGANPTLSHQNWIQNQMYCLMISLGLKFEALSLPPVQLGSSLSFPSDTADNSLKLPMQYLDGGEKIGMVEQLDSLRTAVVFSNICPWPRKASPRRSRESAWKLTDFSATVCCTFKKWTAEVDNGELAALNYWLVEFHFIQWFYRFYSKLRLLRFHSSVYSQLCQRWLNNTPSYNVRSSPSGGAEFAVMSVLTIGGHMVWVVVSRPKFCPIDFSALCWRLDGFQGLMDDGCIFFHD